MKGLREGERRSRRTRPKRLGGGRNTGAESQSRWEGDTGQTEGKDRPGEGKKDRKKHK